MTNLIGVESVAGVLLLLPREQIDGDDHYQLVIGEQELFPGSHPQDEHQISVLSIKFKT